MPLPRLQLFELEDLTWFPATIRDLATDYLRFMEARFDLHRPIVPLLRQALDEAGATDVVDLCSGGGGPLEAMSEALEAQGRPVRVTLTDRYPNLRAFRSLAAQHPAISYVAEPVDATDVPREMKGFRTMFNAFHHFPPEAAAAVLQSAVTAGQPVGIFEIPERTMSTIVPLLFSPVFVLLASPFIRPFLWRRLLWTYLLPLVPLTCWWDGLVSQLRAYTVPELTALTSGLNSGGYRWTTGRVPIGATPGYLTYLIGIPGHAVPAPPA
ncbi:MAG: class I SAM-dependent methyltransferase [Acidobacteriota bacterium]